MVFGGGGKDKVGWAHAHAIAGRDRSGEVELEGLNGGGLEVGGADGVVVGVGDVEGVVGSGEACGFVEAGLGGGAVDEAWGGVAEAGVDVAVAWRDAFDGVVVGIGDVEQVLIEGDGTGVLEAGVAAVAVAVAEVFGARADEGMGAPAGVEVGRADGVGFGVGEEESAVIGGNAAGLGEVGGLEGAVGIAFVAGAGEGPDFFCMEVEDPNLVHSGHGDVEQVVDEGEIDRGSKRSFVCGTGSGIVLSEGPCAGQGFDRVRA